MTPDNPFLKALLADPDDDTLRLAMADWLDENGDAPRAEFIRVQIELARGVAPLGRRELVAWRRRRRELELRQSRLLFAHDADWVAPLAAALKCQPGEWGGWVFRRGFADYFRLGAYTLAMYGSQLAALTPVREIYLEYRKDRDHTADMTGLWQQPWLRSVTHITNLRINVRTAEAMIRAPRLDNLRHLTVSGELPGELWQLLGQRFYGVLGQRFYGVLGRA